MPTLSIGDHKVQVDDSFLSLTPEQQNATVEEIHGHLNASQSPSKPEFHASDAVTDIPAEIARTAKPNIEAITNLANRGTQGPIEGLLSTGRAVAAVPQLAISPVIGALKSLIGHPMAQAEHAVGSVIAPDIAAKDNPEAMYRNAAGDVETALNAARPAGAPVKTVPMGPPQISSLPGGGTMAVGPKPVLEWNAPTAAPRIETPSIGDLKTAATSVYESPAIKGMNIPPSDVAALGAKIQNDLLQQGFRPTQGNAPATFSEVQNLTPGNGVSAVKVDDLRSARRALNIAAGQRDPLTGAPTPDATAAQKAIGHVDSFLDALAPSLKEANANYSAAKGAERLDYRMAKAEHRAARTGIGGNLENVMRQEADKIPDRGLTANEQALRDQIVTGSLPRNALRVAGKLGVDGGLSLMLHTAAATGTGGASLPVTVAGTVARKLGEALTRRDMGRLSTTIRSRSPLAQALAAQATPQPVSPSVLASLLARPPKSGVQLPGSMLPANAQQSQ